jgi:hypothetical protein
MDQIFKYNSMKIKISKEQKKDMLKWVKATTATHDI